MASSLGDRLDKAGDDLSEWYDRLNSYWRDAEARLRRIDVPQPIWVVFRSESYESEDGVWQRDFAHCLGYCKVRGEWRLCYSFGEAGDPDSHQTKPVLKGSLRERELAIKGLPLLLSRMVEAMEAHAAEIETDLGAAAESLAQLKRSRVCAIAASKIGDTMTVREVLKMLVADGWQEVVIRGSHRQFKHPTKPGRVTVAGKPSDDLPPGTLNSILKQSGLKR